MPKLVYGRDKDVAEWVAARIPHVGRGGFRDCAAIGVVTDDGDPIAGLVFHQYCRGYENVQMSMASSSPIWARPEIVAWLLAYPFRQLNVWMAYVLIPLSDARTSAFCERVGFAKPVVIGHAFGRDKHAIQRRMLKPEFEHRYGGKIDGQQEQRSPAAA
jgi:hypothetical protein